MYSDINVTPLVDVCLVLLIIFMVAIPLMTQGTVSLPEVSQAPPHEEEAIAVTVKADRTLHVDTLVVRREQLESELRRVHAASPNTPVAVRADKRVRYGDVADVLAACRAAGWGEVALVGVRARAL